MSSFSVPAGDALTSGVDGGSKKPRAIPPNAEETHTATGTPTSTPLPVLRRPLNRDPSAIAAIEDNIEPCPLFHRMRPSAKEDREDKLTQRRIEIQRAEELQRRRELLAHHVTMGDHFATLFRPLPPDWPAPKSAAQQQQQQLQFQQQFQLARMQELQAARPLGSAGSSLGRVASMRFPSSSSVRQPPTSAPTSQLRTRVMLRKDIQDTFVACYYQMHPEALQRRRESEAAEDQRRRSARASAKIAAFDAVGSRLSNSRSKTPASRRKSKKKSLVRPPPEGSPAVNLRALEAALIDAADSAGLLTREALGDVLSRAPFEVKDADAMDDFFFTVRASSTAGATATESESERRMDASFSFNVEAAALRALRPRGPSMRHPSQTFLSPITAAPLSPTASLGVSSTVRRAGGNQSLRRGGGFTPRSSRAAATNSTTVIASTTEVLPPVQVVRVREALAALDALLNGDETRAAVRGFCFGLLESDGYIHKSALRGMRLMQRESCEGREAVVTPSMVKAVGDVFDAVLQEEELAFTAAQQRGRKGKKKKAPPLAVHQKSAIPLHMMRRSHIDMTTFCRFFDAAPQLASAFVHAWLPVFFSPQWPPIRRVPTYEEVTVDEDNEEVMSEGVRSQREGGEKSSVGLLAAFGTVAQRRGVARRIVTDRMECMKRVALSELEMT